MIATVMLSPYAASCGGSSNSTSSTNPQTGTYVIIVTASAGASATAKDDSVGDHSHQVIRDADRYAEGTS